MNFPTIRRQLLAFSSILLLIGCSGGSSSSSPDSSQPGPTDTPATHHVYRGQALLGPLAGAEVQFYRLPELDGPPLYTTITAAGPDIDTAGTFTLPRDLVEEGRLYLVKVSGGEDLDANDDGTPDARPTVNAGTVHAVLTASQLRSNAFHVSAATEVIYQRLRYLIAADYPADTLLAEINQRAALLLKQDVDGDGDRDGDDIAAWHPRRHASALLVAPDALQALNTAIHQNRDSAITALTVANSYVASITEPVSYGQIAVKGNYLYLVDNSSQFRVIDLGAPSQSQSRGKVNVPGHPRKMIIENNRAYVWGGDDAQLHILDISRPDAPALIGRTGARQYSERFAAYRDYLYSVDSVGSGLKIMDATNPANVATVSTIPLREQNGEYTTMFFGLDIVVQGHAAYVATGAAIWIYDLTTPSNPVKIAKLPQAASRLQIDKDTLYGIRSRDIVAIDIKDPSQAQAKGVIPSPVWINDVAVIDGMLYICSSESLVALDVSNAQAPVVKGAINTPYIYNLATWGPHVLAAMDNSGIKLVTADAFTTRHMIAAIDDPDGINDIAAQGSILYTLAGYRELRTIDVGDPLRYDTLGTVDVWGGSQFTVGDTRVSVTGSGGVDIVNVVNPRAPRVLGRVKSAALNGGVLEGGLAYLVDGNHGLIILDVERSPATLRSITPLSDGARAIALAGTRAAIIDDLGLRFVDVADPDHPRLLSTLRSSNGYIAVAMQGDYVYALENGVIHVIDLREPSRPATVGELITSYWRTDIAVAGPYAYVTGYQGLDVIDIRDPTQPTAAATLAVSGRADSVRVSGNSVFMLVDRYIQAVDVGDPTHPRLSGFLQLPDGISLFDTDGNALYVHSGQWIYRVEPSTTFPTINRYNVNHSYFPWLAAGDGHMLWPSNIGEVTLTDFTNAVNPAIASTFSMPLGAAYGAIVLGDLAYILDSGISIKVMDISDTAAPELIATLPLQRGHGGAHMTIQDSTLVVSSRGAISLIDLGNRRQPRLINTVGFSGGRPAAAGTMGYTVSYPQDGKSELSIHDLASGAVLGALTLPPNSASVFVEQGIAYIPAYEHGILAIDVRDPARPELLGTIASRGHVNDLISIGDLLYIADSAGIYMVKRMRRAVP